MGVFGHPRFVLNHLGQEWRLIEDGTDKTEYFGLKVRDSQLKLEGIATLDLTNPGPLTLPVHFIIRRNGPIICKECSGASSVWFGPSQPWFYENSWPKKLTRFEDLISEA